MMKVYEIHEKLNIDSILKMPYLEQSSRNHSSSNTVFIRRKNILWNVDRLKILQYSKWVVLERLTALHTDSYAIVAGSAASFEIFWRQLWLAVSIPFQISVRRQSHQTNTRNSLSGRGRQRIVSQSIQNDFDTVSTSYFGPCGLACPGSSRDPVICALCN